MDTKGYSSGFNSGLHPESFENDSIPACSTRETCVLELALPWHPVINASPRGVSRGKC